MTSGSLAGLVVLRHGKNVTRFVSAWQQRLQNDPNGWDQGEFNNLLRSNLYFEQAWWDTTDPWDRYGILQLVIAPCCAAACNLSITSVELLTPGKVLYPALFHCHLLCRNLYFEQNWCGN